MFHAKHHHDRSVPLTNKIKKKHKFQAIQRQRVMEIKSSRWSHEMAKLFILGMPISVLISV